jgi:single-stranded-DNA-specific exonuclease
MGGKGRRNGRMSFMKEYSLRPLGTGSTGHTLTEYPLLLQNLLISRGISTRDEAESFFSPKYETGFHDPFLLNDMDKAVARILEAIEKNERILIYSDYDADGIPGGVMMREFFDRIGYENVENYIPHRHDEGYGLHLEAVETFREKGIKLLITVDCGIVDTDQVARARELGIDVIITDHHEPNEKLPEAYAIINPKRKDSTYPEQVLCGSGVAFKLIQGLLQKNRFGLGEGQEKWLLDLVGIATLSDMVPLTGENRTLAHFGLKVLQKSPRPGLQHLWTKLRVNQNNLVEDDIGFSLAPRINAASRMGHPMDGFKLLYTKDLAEGSESAIYLDKINDERKGVVASLVKDIRKRIKEKEKEGNLPSVLVFGNPDWKPALLGLAGNAILDDIKRPIFLWGRNGDKELKGSCRSDGSVSLVALMEASKGVFTQYGGHKMAGGFALSSEAVHTLEEVLNESFKKVKGEKIEDVSLIDAELNVSDISWETYSSIEKLAPFGVGNEKPLFMFRNTQIKSIRQFGKEQNHLELILGDENENIKAIKFFTKPESFAIPPKGNEFRDIVATFEKSTFGYRPELRLRIVDII